ALLDHRAPAIRFTVEPVTPVIRPLVLAARDHILDPVAPQPPPDARVTVALVTGQSDRAATRAPVPSWDADLVHDALELGALLPLPGRHLDGQRQTVAIGHQMHLGSEAPATAAQRVVGGFTGRGIFFSPPRPRLWPRGRWCRRCRTI